MYSLKVLEARSSISVHWTEIKVLVGPCSLWRLQGRICTLPLPASGGCRHPSACGHISPISALSSHTFSSSECATSLCLSLTRTLVIEFKAYLGNPGNDDDNDKDGP